MYIYYLYAFFICDKFLLTFQRVIMIPSFIKIEGKTATFTEAEDLTKPCPICLAENTLISTPDGQIAVQNLKEGMAVWTVDKLDNKVSATIIKTSKTPVPPTHPVKSQLCPAS